MQLISVLLFAALASAIAVPEPTHAAALLGKREEAGSGPIEVEDLSSTTTLPLITAAPENPVRLGEPDYESTSSCKPNSICFDGMSCGFRYGGCFDKNFCAGSTSFPMPTVTCDPSTGLTQNFQKRMEAAAVK